ncbi:guanine nucleotide-binding protein G(I)/G(S)/G(O) subunit gamma-8 isoform X4 [Dromiciops gliroides]|nr:guanine nucleotide-binding protein G(I)/G(S)/G(O) subunit gamma-8 isoform X4 [Dromiciops gliroides]
MKALPLLVQTPLLQHLELTVASLALVPTAAWAPLSPGECLPARGPSLWGICRCINPFLTTTMSNNMAKIAEARKTVEQLKLEVNIERMKVSKAGAELLAFCEAHVKEDPLVTPVPAAENPFREKRLFCVLL